jgi:hypothetical protein
MTTVIESIHAQSHESEAAVSDILSRALLVSSVLGQKNVSAWLKRERDGYSPDEPVPEYRRLRKATLVAKRPGVGWVEAPVTDEVNDALTGFELRQSIAQLEADYAQSQKTGGRRLDLPEERQREIRAQIKLDAQLGLAVPLQAYARALEGVRAAIDLWTAELMQAGIAGQGTSFRREEREAARGVGERLDELLAAAAAEAEKRSVLVTTTGAGLLARLLGR